MYISRFQVKNFKLFQDIVVEFNPILSIFTGVNNSGKTTLLQALSLWYECFSKLIRQAGRGKRNYKKNDYLILLDEPDSHIHRDIQSRLLQIITNFSQGNQVFMATHNEAIIRNANLSNLFHLDSQATGRYKSIDANLITVNPRFSGIYPSPVNPVIIALGMVNGLDFINAIESDHLIFVEGVNDANAINILLKQNIGNYKKYVYWVLGGVNEVSERILHYKTVFSEVKNNQTLWEKSVLIMDRDFLSDIHQSTLADEFQNRINLKSHIWSAYTFESTLFTDISKLAR